MFVHVGVSGKGESVSVVMGPTGDQPKRGGGDRTALLEMGGDATKLW